MQEFVCARTCVCVSQCQDCMMDPVCTFVVHIIGKNDYARINKSNQERLELHKVISCRMTKTLAT